MRVLWKPMWKAPDTNMAADTGMETCPSPEIADSRKRPLDGDVENGTTKRSHYGGGCGEETYHLKILVPSIAAGAIIGKGGETIAQLQKDTGARVKMSKANDFYPGTSERVCLITGTSDAVMTVLIFIMEKIREKPDLSAKQAIDFDNKMASERDKQVKVLVPNSTAGMIIGKAGSFIKQVKEESGSYVQVSQKAKEQTLHERCITIIGDMESNKKACHMILTKVMEDPQSGSCLNVSYADVSGPVANFNPTGSPYANHGQATPMHTGTYSSTTSLTSMGGLMMNGGPGLLNLTVNLSNPGSPISPSVTAQLLDHVKMNLRSNSYSDQSANEIANALNTLAQYGMLGLNTAAMNHQSALSNYLGHSPMDASPSLQQSHSGGTFGPIGTVSGPGTASPRQQLDRYGGDVGQAGGSYDVFRNHGTSPTGPLTSPGRISGPLASPAGLGLNNNSFGLGTAGRLCKSPTQPGAEGEQKKMDIEIGENIVGAILGPGGRSLVEIQSLSGASVQISKKGTFAPGTRNRIVSIAGPSAAISTAQYLIEQRIAEEEAKRTRHSGLGLMQQ